MRLSTKLMLMTCILLLAFVALGAFSAKQLKNVNQKSNEISTNWLPSTVAVQRINTLTSDYRIHEISYIYAGAKADKADIEQNILNVSFELNVAMNNYKDLISTSKEHEIFNKFCALWEDYMRTSEEMFAMARDNNMLGAVYTLRNKSQQLFNEASVELLKAVNFNREHGTQASLESDIVYKNSLKLIYLGIALVTILATCVCGWIMFTISRQLGKDPAELIKITGRVVNNDYDIDDNKTHYGVYKHLLVMVSSLKHHIDNAEKNARIKSEFLANMSHEIRTPMNGILGLLHLVSHTELNAKQEDYIQKCLFSANNLLRIIDDILDFSKMEAGKLEFEALPFDIESLCLETDSLYSAPAQEKGLELKIDSGNCPKVLLEGDPLRVKQVLFNFVSNAIKFTEKGTISVNVHCEDIVDNILPCVFSVKDTGIGLSKEQQDRLFSPFTQADTSITRKYGGTGLGLVICKKIVESMQGGIWVESDEGAGATFYFALNFPLYTGLLSETERSVEIIENTQNTGGEHLLLVEDNDINQIIAQELLEEVGYKVDVANNGQEALDLLEKKRYAAVLMDIQMPVMDGFTATQKIRENSALADMIVIAMSAHAMQGDYELSLQKGMNDHVTKPIDPQKLYLTLEHWLAKKK